MRADQYPGEGAQLSRGGRKPIGCCAAVSCTSLAITTTPNYYPARPSPDLTTFAFRELVQTNGGSPHPTSCDGVQKPAPPRKCFVFECNPRPSSKMGFLRTTFASLAILASATATPNANLKRQVSQLRPSYDFVVVGGGTTGLTVADRVTAALPSSQ